MGFLTKIFGGGETAVAGVTAVGNVLDNLFTSKDEKLTHEEVRIRLAQQPDMAQVELNKIEASSRHWFTASWRPAIGWACALGIFNMILVNPWIQWITGVAGPDLPKDILLEIVFGMLGLGTLRTIEKIQGKTK
jgi:hypothetical protein